MQSTGKQQATLFQSFQNKLPSTTPEAPALAAPEAKLPAATAYVRRRHAKPRGDDIQPPLTKPERPHQTSGAAKPCKRKRSFEQTFLDFGQKELGSRTCEECGMVYAHGTEDEQIHTVYHKAFCSAVPFKGWANERVERTWGADRVISVSRDDPVAHFQKVRQVLQMASHDLGDFAERLALATDLERVYLYIDGAGSVAGMVVAQSSVEAALIDATCTETVQTRQPLASKKGVPGVQLVWVHWKFRRRQIASRMLDTVRETLMFGCNFQREQLAFSAPTTSGRCLAENYTKTPDIWIYV
eukprot:TRINITY_DN45514_c0_g1_i1.p1 TRINITY_DN45514_c0_g1~~TRINITY_DN45514_c0_g1_i1.p1  ORF type:complete len:299 (-),score=44.27 TRINITY_DN45514_c0_g1_i1:109-1005(-)